MPVDIASGRPYGCGDPTDDDVQRPSAVRREHQLLGVVIIW
jgi:hypothetical protein